jgi:hypothetical protein
MDSGFRQNDKEEKRGRILREKRPDQVIYSSAVNYKQVIPAKAGIHGHYNRQLDCGIRRNDGGEVFSQHFGSSNLQLCIQLQTGHPGEGRDPCPLQPTTGLRHPPQ